MMDQRSSHQGLLKIEDCKLDKQVCDLEILLDKNRLEDQISGFARATYKQGKSILYIYEGRMFNGEPHGFGRILQGPSVKYAFWKCIGQKPVPNGKYIHFEDKEVVLQGKFVPKEEGKKIALYSANDGQIKNLLRNVKAGIVS